MDKLSAEEKVYRYPWARALMIVVLYGALLVFLWHFPTPGGRAFFQALFKGFLYVFAGLALIGITVIFFLFFPIPPVPEKLKHELLNDTAADEAGGDDDWYPGSVYTARALIAPTFKNPDVEPRVWDVLYAIEREDAFGCDIYADPDTGVIAISDDDDDEAAYVLNSIRSRLKAAGIATRSPR